MRRFARAWWVGAVCLAVTLAGCVHSGPVRTADSPFAACPAPVTAATTATAKAAGGGGEAAPATHLPDVSLPCFTGGTPVRLAGLGRPAVLNLWASYCAPCRQELPAFQQFSALAGNRLDVLGVITNDTDSKAASLAQDLKVSFPAVTDPQGSLLRAMGQNALPITLFVAADGRVVHLDRSGQLDLATLQGLTKRYLGVSVG